MSFKLDKNGVSERDDLIGQLQDKHRQLEEYIETANSRIQEINEELAVKVREYNEVRDEVTTFVSQRAEDWREEFDGKSEKWQESDVGQDAENHISSWENFTMDALEDITVDSLEVPNDDSDDLAALPDAP